MAETDSTQDAVAISDLNEDARKIDLIPTNTKGSIFKKKYCHRNVSILTAVIGLLIAITILSCTDVNEQKPVAVCNSNECIRSSANIKLSLDTSVDPCDDFHRFACGKWSEQHINHGWYETFTGWEEIDERVSMNVLKFLESDSKAEEPVPVRQARDFYRACMDVVTLDKLGTSVITNYLKQVGLSRIPTFFSTPENKTADFEFDWVKVGVNVKRTIAKDLFVPFYISEILRNESAYVMRMGQYRLQSLLPSPFKVFPRVQYIKWYKRAIQMTMKIFLPKPFNNAQLTNATEIIWNMTVATAKMSAATKTEPGMQNITVQALQNLTDQRFVVGGKDKPAGIWRRYLTLLFENVTGVTLDLDKSDHIYYMQGELDYVINMTYYFSTVPNTHVELYAWWLTVSDLITNTNSEVSEYIRQSTKIFTPITTAMTRKMTCVSLTSGFLPYPVAYGIAKEVFTSETKVKVDTMIRRLKLAFLERLAFIDWMDARTKNETRLKMLQMQDLVGYPDWLYNTTAMEKRYSDVTIRNNTHLENMISVITNEVSQTLAFIGEGNQEIWKVYPIIVNAYYVFQDNAINVPMVILSYPLYHLGLESLNYGAIGTLLGHELTHGFDDIGRYYDKYGNAAQWWSNETVETFRNKTQCLINQYSNYALPNTTHTINGAATLNENLADNGGLHTAYLAYKHLREMDGAEDALPGLENYTSDQLFFMSFANSWCQTASSEALLKQIQTDIHSPRFVRILGTLQNSYEFASAFNCPVGSPMNPTTTKCRIW